MLDGPIVTYFRVSTVKQGLSGLGLEAQQMAVYGFLQGSATVLTGEFTEVETGTRRRRPQLDAALALCRQRRATLVIAKIDRLARNVAFVSALLESQVRFLAVDMPDADRAFLQMTAVFAELEARRISERTKAALAAAKARGTKLGWSHPDRLRDQREASLRGAAANRAAARQFAANVGPVVDSIRATGATTLKDIARALNARGIATPRGGNWHPSTVSRLLEASENSGAASFG